MTIIEKEICILEKLGIIYIPFNEKSNTGYLFNNNIHVGYITLDENNNLRIGIDANNIKAGYTIDEKSDDLTFRTFEFNKEDKLIKLCIVSNSESENTFINMTEIIDKKETRYSIMFINGKIGYSSDDEEISISTIEEKFSENFNELLLYCFQKYNKKGYREL